MQIYNRMLPISEQLYRRFMTVHEVSKTKAAQSCTALADF
jgi:hypothetical protein